jgi:hypothetical protein
VHVRPRAANLLHHGAEGLVAVDQDGHVVSGSRRRRVLGPSARRRVQRAIAEPVKPAPVLGQHRGGDSGSHCAIELEGRRT